MAKGRASQMTPQTATLMANYNRWMNQRMYEAASRLPEEEVTKDRGAFFGSLRQTLNHIAVGDTIWLHRFAQHPEASALRTEMTRFPQPTSLRQDIAASLGNLQNTGASWMRSSCNGLRRLLRRN